MSRQVIVGVGGGIAAYKATGVVRELSRAGFSVSVLPTKASLNLVGETTWAALSGNPVYVDPFIKGGEVAHIELARKADLIVLVAATADLLARIRLGLAPDMLGNVLLASTAPLVIAPAMHTAMWHHPATQENVKVLRQRGAKFIGPVAGELSSGDQGLGRLAPETDIVSFALQVLDKADTEKTPDTEIENASSTIKTLANLGAETGTSTELAGKQVLITAGGTRENLDPVRFIGNRSSGIFGAYLAIAAQKMGAEVEVLAAHLSAQAQELLRAYPQIKISSTPEARVMLEAVEDRYEKADIIIMAAAVADYRPAKYAEEKIKKTADNQGIVLELVKNPDILATIAKRSQLENAHPSNTSSSSTPKLIVGFAAETGSEAGKHAQEKAKRKGADLIFFNQVSLEQGFGAGETAITALDKNAKQLASWQGEKSQLAPQMMEYMAEKYLEKIRSAMAPALFDEPSLFSPLNTIEEAESE